MDLHYDHGNFQSTVDRWLHAGLGVLSCFVGTTQSPPVCEDCVVVVVVVVALPG